MLKSKPLGRTNTPVPPVIWRVGGTPIDPAAMRQSLQAGADWIYVPSDTDDAWLAQAAQQLAPVEKWSILLGMTAGGLHARAAKWVEARLAVLGLRGCAGILIESADPGQIKSGGPFHRLMQLRDRGLAELSLVEARDGPTAEWLVDNTPAHAVVLPFGLRDQSARYRIFESAMELQVGLIAVPPVSPVWTPPEPASAEPELAFVAAQPAIAAVLQPMPADVDALQRTLGAVAQPMGDEERERWWSAFQRDVRPPPKPVRNLPPEFGA